MTNAASKASMRKSGPVAAFCRTPREAAVAAADLRRAGFDPRRIAIVANDLPATEAGAGIGGWSSLAPSWVTVGCLNAIGSGLEGLGIGKGCLGRCRRALRSDGILVVVHGTPEEVGRARRACRRR
jgi:hypothetical protein